MFVGDVKYKRDTSGGKSPDLYQLLAYATGTGLPEATLIYAEGPPEPQVHVVGGAGVRLRIEHVDLSRAPEQLLEQLDAVAERVRTRATAVPVSSFA